MANVDELDRIVTYLEDHPEKHVQDVWTCNTGACLAGTAVLQNGYARVSSPFSYRGETVRDPAGNEVKVREAAIDLLDLTEAQAQLLFGAENDITNIRAMVKDMANGEDITKLWRTSDIHDRALPMEDYKAECKRFADAEEQG